MRQSDIILIPLQPEDREQFILDNQWAFKYGAQQEFGMRDERCEEGEEVISRKTIEDSMDGINAETYRITLDGQKVGGVALQINKESGKGELELLFVLPEVHWSMDDEMFVFRKVIMDPAPHSAVSDLKSP